LLWDRPSQSASHKLLWFPNSVWKAFLETPPSYGNAALSLDSKDSVLTRRAPETGNEEDPAKSPMPELRRGPNCWLDRCHQPKKFVRHDPAADFADSLAHPRESLTVKPSNFDNDYWHRTPCLTGQSTYQAPFGCAAYGKGRSDSQKRFAGSLWGRHE
jgi:hypothetical protein